MKIRLAKNNSYLKSLYTMEEEAEIYKDQLDEIINNLGWYLDQVEYMVEYRVSWKNYSTKTPTIPWEFTKKE